MESLQHLTVRAQPALAFPDSLEALDRLDVLQHHESIPTAGISLLL